MYKKGFTILELLIVIAIIGILTAVIIASLADSRNKAKIASFKSEMDSIVPALISVCHDRIIVAADIPGGSTYAAATVDPATQNCGPSGAGTFAIPITPTNGAMCSTGTVTDIGVIYSGC